ncbi:hypothetical protein WMF27_41085 [Sorangium sp. So ce281]|uniref:hypothetical protein n=1 Tax=unclassified Sorangium TaxID=2621164 RepID=UPI003F5FC2E5
MSNVSTFGPQSPDAAVPYIIRVLTADATKEGAATAVAGLPEAASSEAIWPSSWWSAFPGFVLEETAAEAFKRTRSPPP